MSSLLPLAPPVEPRNEAETQLLREGFQLVMRKGFNHTSVNDITQAAGVPKGSFYYYFKNKEAFGLKLIEHYHNHYLSRLQRIEGMENLNAYEKLLLLFRQNYTEFAEAGYVGGCLIGNLSQEMAGQTETFRLTIHETLQSWLGHLGALIETGQAEGSIAPDKSPDELVRFLLLCIEGAILKAKVEKSTATFLLIERLFFEGMLKT